MSKDREDMDDWYENSTSEFEEESSQYQRSVEEDDVDFEFDDEEGLESYLSDAVAKVYGEEQEEEIIEESSVSFKWGLRKKLLVSLGTVVGSLVMVVVLAVGWVLFRINEEEGVRAASDLSKEQIEAQATLPPWDEDQALLDADVVNVLLIGREGINDGEDAYGRSDSMIIASMNTKENTLKMVSIMRDCYVDIYGYRANKLNAAYSYGGGELLVDTIQRNFGIPLEGYIVVDFKAFETVINAVDGVEITLTPTEADYLNTTNYISKKKYRTVVEGTQEVNGNQALGYCRVRHVAAVNGENDDYGRTYRQRAVLSQVYSKVMSELNPTEAVSLANELLGYVKTNISSKDLLSYVQYILGMGVDSAQLEQLRIPVNNSYSSPTLYCGSSLVLDFEKNKSELWMFLYGTADRNVMTVNPGSDGYVSTTVSTYTPSTYQPVQATQKPVAVVTTAPTKQITVTEAPVDPTDVEVVTEVPKRTKAPAPVVTEAPAPVVTEAPAPVVTEAPAAVVTEAPAPVVTEAPAPQDNGEADSVG